MEYRYKITCDDRHCDSAWQVPIGLIVGRQLPALLFHLEILTKKKNCLRRSSSLCKR
jgi:hypothetical protein